MIEFKSKYQKQLYLVLNGMKELDDAEYKIFFNACRDYVVTSLEHSTDRMDSERNSMFRVFDLKKMVTYAKLETQPRECLKEIEQIEDPQVEILLRFIVETYDVIMELKQFIKLQDILLQRNEDIKGCEKIDETIKIDMSEEEISSENSEITDVVV